MNDFDLTAIANSPGFGSGRATRDLINAMTECLNHLPPPQKIAPVCARPVRVDQMVHLAHFGDSTETGEDWEIVHSGVRLVYADDFTGCLGYDAKSDAEIIAAIVNAYRLGHLVRADRPKG